MREQCVKPEKRSEEHTSELRHQIISYAVFCLKKKSRFRRASRGGRTCGSLEKPRVGRARQVLVGMSPRDEAKEPGPRSVVFFFNDTATTEIYTLSLHDALPI